MVPRDGGNGGIYIKKIASGFIKSEGYNLYFVIHAFSSLRHFLIRVSRLSLFLEKRLRT